MRILNYRLIFIHVPRCGGTSINDAFLRSGMIPGATLDYRLVDLVHLYGKIPYGRATIELDHCTFQHMKVFCSPYEIGTFYKFAVVRDPVQRMVSVYRRAFHESDFRILGSREIASFTEFVDGLEWLSDKGYFDVGKVMDLPHANVAHYIPQSLYVCDVDGSIRVDKLIDISNLENGVNEILKEHGYPEIRFAESNRSDSAVSVSASEIDRNRDRIERIYQEDYRLMESIRA